MTVKKQTPARIWLSNATPEVGELVRVRAMITHRMETGLRLDPEGNPTTKNIIHTFTATLNDEPLFSWYPETAISQNPYIEFTFVARQSGELRLEWVADDGEVFTGSSTLTVPNATPIASAAKVIVVGGGFGGATAARYIKQQDPSIQVTLIEPNRTFYTCPFSNLYLAGLRTLDQQAHGYEGLKALGVEVIHDYATAVDAEKKTVRLAEGQALPYDKLLLSPGVDFRWNELEGYDEAASLRAPHAWKSNEQIQLLRLQLKTMEDGGTFVMSVPENPFRCPPGPYERASMVAHYLKQHKPKSKILILDAKEAFSKQALFQEGWERYYGDMIEWVPLSQDGKIRRVDATNLTVESDFGEIHHADVLNVIPPQKAGAIADAAGVTDASGWVPVNPNTFESTQVPDIYVVGDATQAAPMPKSGFSANSQARVAATAIIHALTGKEAEPAQFANACYSLIAPDHGIAIAHVYAVQQQKIAELSGGTSPLDADAAFRKYEAEQGQAWYKNISADIWGTQS